MLKLELFVVLTSTLVAALPPPHPLVVAVRREEDLLPSSLRSPVLHNPHLQNILPLTSLLHKGEKFVYERDSDNIPRKEIYKILTHAGFVPRGQYVESLPFFSDHLFTNPDLLQYLK